MKKVVIFSSGILIIILIFFFLEQMKYTSFESVVLDNISDNEITSINIIRGSDDEEVRITEGKEITSILNDFSSLELKKNKSHKNTNESYWITIKENDERVFGLTLHGSDYLSIFNYEEDSSEEYRITDGSQMESVKKNFE